MNKFAVLLGANDFTSGGCDSDWIWITSLSLLVAAFGWVIICVGLFYWNVSFRALMSGYERNMKVSTLLKNVMKREQ